MHRAVGGNVFRVNGNRTEVSLEDRMLEILEGSESNLNDLVQGLNLIGRVVAVALRATELRGPAGNRGESCFLAAKFSQCPILQPFRQIQRTRDCEI